MTSNSDSGHPPALSVLLISDLEEKLSQILKDIRADIEISTAPSLETASFAAIDCLICDGTALGTGRPANAPSQMGIIACVTTDEEASAALDAGADEVLVCSRTPDLRLLERRLRSVVGTEGFNEHSQRLQQSAILAVAGGDSFEGALNGAIGAICEETILCGGAAWLPGRNGVRPLSSHGHTPSESVSSPERKATATVAEDVFSAGEPQWGWCDTDDGETDWTCVGIPIESDDGIVAVLELYATERQPRNERLLEVLSALGTQLGTVLVRRRVEDHLARERQLTTRIFEASPVGIVLLDATDTVLRANDRANELLDFSQSTATVDWTVTDDYGEPDPGALCPIKRVRERSEPVFGANVSVDVDGEHRWLSVNAVPLEGVDSNSNFNSRPHSHPHRIVISVTDMTEQKRYAREIGRQRQRLEVLNRVIRHDIRTTANLLLGYAEMLPETGDIERVSNELTAIARHMGRLSDNVHQLPTTDTTSRPEAEMKNVSALLEDCIASLRDTHPAAAVTTTIEPDRFVRTTVELEAAFDHLLENAVIHTVPNPVLTVDLTVDSAENTLTVTITDDGPGIPAEELAVIEQQCETPLEHSSGLGLWLASWVIDAADGSLSFSVDDGTTVTVQLPLALDAEPAI